jgi:hypothetical protein
MTPLLSPKTSGKRPGKQMRKGLRLGGRKRILDADKLCSGFARSLEAAGYDRFGALPLPKLVVRPLRHASCCFPHASPVFHAGTGEAKNGPARTLDPKGVEGSNPFARRVG